MIAEDDKVVMRCTLTGTHNGQFPEFLAVSSTNRAICQQQIHILRVRDRQLVEYWVIRDDLAVMRQLGVSLIQRANNC
ncbi:ester cyclase [Gloeocapsopsis crepidinum]|uniref:ester cyclase n=1 Tax=Gloeocapsopsis crepidinum TaxID=693223 RepID=UPI0022401564|nr:ester cyclase [Gloeocapsopsis crepidinum]